MSNNNFRAERKKNALDNRKLNLSAPCPSAPGKFSNLSWRLVNNNPRIYVYTNDPADMTDKNNNGLITANLDAPVFFTLMEMLHKMVDAEPGTKERIENKNYIFPNGKKSEKPLVVSEIIVGKDKEGVIFISVLAYDKSRPRIKFDIVPSDFHHLYHSNGEPFTKAQASQLYTRGYIRCLESIMHHLLVDEWVEVDLKSKNGRFSNNNNNNNEPRRQETQNTEYDDDDLNF